jgi:hypothetical protein
VAVLKPGAFLFCSVFSDADEYYRNMVTAGGQREAVITDPANGIRKRLYSEEEIKAFFQHGFNLRYFLKLQFPDAVLGSTYWRDFLVLLLEK